MGERKSSKFQQADAFFTSRFSLAQVVYGLFTFVVALVLLSQIGTQARFFDNLAFEKQPGLWPLISITGMLVFGFFQVIQYWLHRHILTEPKFSSEFVIWLKALEYAAWFMAYVLIVPVTGYLLSTVAVAVLLTLRLGYRNFRMVAAAIICAVVIVVLFKSFLQVRIPGGMIYDFLPGALRNFMIINL